MKLYTTRMIGRFSRILGACILTALIMPSLAFSQSPLPVALGAASTFELLAGTTITNVGLSIINGDIGVFPSTGNVIVGFPPGVVTGGTYIGVGPASIAQSALTTAYLDAAGRTTNSITQNGDLGGLTLAPGLYTASTSLLITGNVTLDAQGNANAVWIFQVGSALTTATNSQVVLANGAQAKNIFWQVGSSATLGTGSTFYGNILALQSISISASTIMVGRALARNGAVTSAGAMNGMNPDLLPSNAPIFSTASRRVDVGPTHVDSVKWTLITITNPGTANLVITSATSSNTAFSSHLSGLTVAPGASITDSIKFLSPTMGPDSAKLVFLSNAASSPDTIVVLATGVKAILYTASRNITLLPTHVDSTSWTLITLKNTGNDTLRMTAVSSTNNVFASHLSALLIAPGDSVIDSIRYHPILMGIDSGKLVFRSNAVTSPDTITVRSIGKAAVLRLSSRNVNLGSTKVGTPTSTVISLTNTGNDTLRITSSSSTNAFFTSHLSGLTIPPGSQVVDLITFLPTTMGLASGKLIFTSNASAVPETVSVQGVGLAAVLSASSRNIDAGTTSVGTRTWTLISLINTGNDTLRFTSATSTTGVFSSHLSDLFIVPGGTVTDSIAFSPTAMGPVSGTLLLSSNALTSPDTIAIHGVGRAAVLVISDRNVNCGSTPVETAVWTSIILSNTGNDTLRISAALSTSTDFSSRLSSLVIAPGASINDSIRFFPSTVGTIAAKLVFVSNAMSSPDTINVRGVGLSNVRTALLSAASRNVNCGTAMIGNHTWTLNGMSNMGNDTLRITSVTSTNPAFASSMSNMLIPPGGSVVDLIVFVPTKLGPDAGLLIFVSNAPSSPDTIHVYGNGTPLVGVSDGTAPAAVTLASLYPNPVVDATQLIVRLQGNEQVVNAGMYDMLGHELQNWTSRVTPNGSLALRLGTYPKGTYMVRVQTTSRMQVVPMMIVN